MLLILVLALFGLPVLNIVLGAIRDLPESLLASAERVGQVPDAVKLDASERCTMRLTLIREEAC